MSHDKPIALRARYVFPAGGEPIRDGIVTLSANFHGSPISISKTSDVEPKDLGNVAIVFGLVNAHVHLEFSELPKPLGIPGEPLPTWIRRVIDYRRSGYPTANAIELGLRECLRCGVAGIGEINTRAWPDHSWAPFSINLFHEMISLDRGQFDTVRQSVERKLSRHMDNVKHGLSPHAPYTVHPELFDQIIEWAMRDSLQVSMHLAESPEELELLRTGCGPFRELLEELGVWRDDANPAGRRPLDYLRRLCNAPRALVAHGNYLDDEEIDFAADHADRLALIYCPRTHAFFGHSPYPLRKMLSRGLTMCLGTDSRASNPDLDLFEEMKFAARSHSDVSPRQILEMATVNGARMLDVQDGIAGVKLPNRDSADPFELLFDDTSVIGDNS